MKHLNEKHPEYIWHGDDIIMLGICGCSISCCLVRCSHVDPNCVNHSGWTVNKCGPSWEAKVLNQGRSVLKMHRHRLAGSQRHKSSSEGLYQGQHQSSS